MNNCENIHTFRASEKTIELIMKNPDEVILIQER